MAARPDAIFVADSLGLDFLNSIATPVNTPVEWLSSGEDLLEWLDQARLVPADVLAGFRANTVPGELDAVAAQARALREWFRTFVYEHKGKPLRPNTLVQLAPLNRILEREDQYNQIAKRDRHDNSGGRSGLALRAVRRWRSPETLLLPISSALAELVCNEDFSHVKACEGPTCTLLFLDRTHGRARRWCSMAACGNRAKQAAHRDRVRRESD
jgi:predicted RNA-binding Zn ribbon-like protein